MLINIASIKFYDEESNSEAFSSIGIYEDKIALSISIKENGDIDTLMGKEDAKAIADALYKAVGDTVARKH